MEITVRPATTEDAERMMQIQLDCIDKVYPSVYSRKEVDAWIEKLAVENYRKKVQATGWCYVAVIDNGEKAESIVGYAYLNLDLYKPPLVPYHYKCELQIESLYVDPEYHGRGIGRELMHVIERKAKAEGCTRLGVASSLYAVPFYEHIGYNIVQGDTYCIVVGVMVKILVKNLQN